MYSAPKINDHNIDTKFKAPESAPRIAVLLTCFNRRPTTLTALDHLFHQDCIAGVRLEVFLVDDGSTDGTGDAVKARFPQVHVIEGTGSLYWSGGMRVAMGEALQHNFDHYVWLNDDTMLDADALRRLLATEEALRARGFSTAIVVGSTRDPQTGVLTYGGVVRLSRWRTLKFGLVPPGDSALPCDTMNGNCVLIPHSVAALVGNPSAEFVQGIGDFDYGLRARCRGCTVWVAHSFIGTCARNSVANTWQDPTLSLRQRWSKLTTAKGLPRRPWVTFARRHAGLMWPAYAVWPYVCVVAGCLRRAKLQ
jgi:GT2 family glycosyltransferase